MPFCPSCRYEYRAEVTKCPDCSVDLVEALAPEQESEWVELVRVASYPYDGDAQVALLRLNSHGIHAVISNEKIAQTDMILAFADGGVHICVGKDDAARARKVLEEED